VKTHTSKSSAPFLPFLGNPAQNSAAGIFLGPLLCFAAEISAGWQHWFSTVLQHTEPGIKYCTVALSLMLTFVLLTKFGLVLQYCIIGSIWSFVPVMDCSENTNLCRNRLTKKGGRRCHLLLDKRWHLLHLLTNKPGTGHVIMIMKAYRRHVL
jgi:hypothetical protein